MKKISFILLGIVAVAIASCEKSSDPTPEKETLTGLPLVKKVFEQVSGPNALAIMNRSVYTLERKDSDEYAIRYVYKTSADSIYLHIYNDTVEDARVLYKHSGNTLATTCLSYLQNNFGSCPVVKSVALDSVEAYVVTNRPWDQYIPTTPYRLHKYQDVVDSLKNDTKMLECDMRYLSRALDDKLGSPVAVFWCEYFPDQNATELEAGYYVLMDE